MNLLPPQPDCRGCARWEQAPRNPGVPTTRWGLPGPDAPVLIVIGPTPGYHEHTHNEPFVGKQIQSYEIDTQHHEESYDPANPT